MAEKNEALMDKIVSLAKRRGFIFPGSEIYGGLANAWDYGPLGVEMKNNIKARWWQTFVHRRSDMFGLDAALLMNTKAWEASGHLKEFSDPLVECKACHERFRAEDVNGKTCPICKKGELTSAKQFNLMLKTHLGPVESKDNEVYFRPETAQGIFVNFKNVVDTMRPKLPFGIAQIGKAFRNEITPGNFIFRTREFEQMEIEYFVPVADWQKYFEEWRLQMLAWIADLGIDKKDIHELEVPAKELAHYSKRTIDFEYKFPFGQKELFGLAYRTDFDLTNHGLDYTDDEGQKLIPHVIEPSLGVDRSLLAALLSAYHEETDKEGIRVVLKLPIWLAPVNVAVFPLMKNKPELVAKARDIFSSLKQNFSCVFDDNGNVGKRYRRQDEIGTPFCVTVDFDSLEKDTVTVRDRDTMGQEIIKISELKDYLATKLK
jgi:glycyl-tRNA synthetase